MAKNTHTEHHSRAQRRAELSAKYVSGILDYDPETGVFRWRETGSGRRINLIAGCKWPKASGVTYISICIDQVVYYAHRLAYLIMIGEWPDAEIDHINCDGTDNRWVNLRPATAGENKMNRRCQRNNALGIKGVFWDKQRRLWSAEIHTNYRRRILGHFQTVEEAAEAYAKAAAKYHKTFARC